jgi:hypothetical protein
VAALSAWTESRRKRFREHVALTFAFVLSRVLLALAGLRLNFDLAWMFLADPKDLHENLLETLFYFHAYPPGMSCLSGLFLKLGGSHAAVLAEVAHAALGLVLVNSLLYTLRALAVPPLPAFALAALFALAPATIYLEHLWLWEEWVAALLALAAALFFHALKRPSFQSYLAFFSVCSLVSWIRSSFQLTWFLALVGLALWLAQKSFRRQVALAALGPLLLLLGLHLKNWLLFGVFGASSAGGGNMTHITVSRLPQATRSAWIRSGKLSQFAAHSVYAGPAEYVGYVDQAGGKRFRDIPVLQALERPTVHAPNYNHWIMLEVSRRREHDALTYLSERPFDYARTTLQGLEQFLGPTTRWHPFDKTERSPHHAHRLVLGQFERFWNDVWHRLPLKGPGLYTLFPIALVWAVRRVWKGLRTQVRERRARVGLLLFALFQVGYVTATSMLFTIGESSRYRHQVEAQIWLISAVALLAGWRRLR